MMGKNKKKILKVKKFLVCPNCGRPYFKKSALKIKGAGRGYGFCGHCGFELRRAFKGTPAGKGIKIPKRIQPTIKPDLSC